MAGTSTTAAASGPVHPQTSPILIGALAPLAPAACGVVRAVVAANPPANSNVAVSAATLRRRLLITLPPVYRSVGYMNVVCLTHVEMYVECLMLMKHSGRAIPREAKRRWEDLADSPAL